VGSGWEWRTQIVENVELLVGRRLVWEIERLMRAYQKLIINHTRKWGRRGQSSSSCNYYSHRLKFVVSTIVDLCLYKPGYATAGCYVTFCLRNKIHTAPCARKLHFSWTIWVNEHGGLDIYPVRPGNRSSGGVRVRAGSDTTVETDSRYDSRCQMPNDTCWLIQS